MKRPSTPTQVTEVPPAHGTEGSIVWVPSSNENKAGKGSRTATEPPRHTQHQQQNNRTLKTFTLVSPRFPLALLPSPFLSLHPYFYFLSHLPFVSSLFLFLASHSIHLPPLFSLNFPSSFVSPMSSFFPLISFYIISFIFRFLPLSSPHLPFIFLFLPSLSPYLYFIFSHLLFVLPWFFPSSPIHLPLAFPSLSSSAPPLTFFSPLLIFFYPSLTFFSLPIRSSLFSITTSSSFSPLPLPFHFNLFLKKPSLSSLSF